MIARADPALRRAARGQRHDRAPRPEQPEVAEHVLAVLRPDDHEVTTARILLRAPGQVGDVGELVAQLGREQVDEHDVLGRRLEQGGRGRQEVDVGVRGPPALRPQVDRTIDRDLEPARRRVRRPASARTGR